MTEIKKHVKEILKIRKKTFALILSALFLVLVLTMSYAFFTGIGNNEHKFATELSTGTMELAFLDGDAGVNAELMIGESVRKKFIIENSGSLEASLSLDWKELLNTYQDGSLSYRLERVEDDAVVETIVPESNMPVSDTRISQTLASEISVPAETTYYYDLVITFNNLEFVNQDADKDALFNTSFNVGLPLVYRYYKLVVDPNGGTWKEFTSAQTYQLKNNESLEGVDAPTRVGYTFDGWDLKGVSSTLTDGKFTMGISDAFLVAKWSPNSYNVTINVDGGEYSGEKELDAEYGSTITLSTPTRNGYTFSHWEVTGGTVNGNVLTITDPSNVAAKAVWTPNKYSYIVKHNKQNVSGNGYTTFETESKENIDFGTEVTPEFKTYEGFTQPTEKKTIVIKEDTTQNVVEYNYTRNKYTLTVNSDGGTGGTETQEVFYEGTVSLTAPTKVGYDFLNWSVESGTGKINDNIFIMGIGNTSIKASYRKQEYSLTFNPNGGSVITGSKKITYGGTYGDLPVATRTGYEFLGWFESQTGGNEVTSSTPVDAEGNVTVYAGWKANNYKLTLNLNGGTYDGTLPESIDYDSTITLKKPTKTGHNFSGWSVSTGTINGDKFTMNGTSDVTITATWSTNSYNYKVIHKKMNIDGSTYTDADTVTGSLAYGSSIPNTPKTTYGAGFGEGTCTSGTISEDESANEVVCTYPRNKFTLTINPNGGTYSGNTTVTDYYEKQITLGSITKTGHTFINWSTPTIGTLSGSKYTIGAGNETLTANFTTNNYKYIVYHKKQNINDNNYTIVTADTVSTETAFGTKVTPPVKNYGLGFVSPGTETKIIQEDTNPPTKNIWNYNYNRSIFKLTLNLDRGTLTGGTSFDMRYEATKSLGTPSKTGYSFNKWIKSSGASDSTLTGSTFKMGTGATTVKATYNVNSYGYTVQHKVQDIDSDTYTLRDTDTGLSANYGTDVTGTPKTTYTGFKAGTCNTITISENSSNNIVECKYQREKYTLTINPNGGTYSGNTTVTDYYEKQITLGSVTKTGYTHTWSVTSGSGSVASNKFTFGTGNATVKANWTPIKSIVTLNANGGNFGSSSVITKTTTVTYDSTYGAGTLGSLPTPTRDGYEFVGWYTTSASTGGNQRTDSTKVSITSSQTLYARWKEEQFNIPKAVTAILNNRTVTGYNTGTPTFANAAKSDEGVYAMEDDYGTSYYYRGAVTNNYVKFGGFYWRIIRINGDGSLRMIYDGTSYHANGENNADRYTENHSFHESPSAAGAGYMSGDDDSAKGAQTNTYDSAIKEYLDTWYENNILANKANEANGNTNISEYLTDTIFCNDRTLPAEGETWWEQQDSTHSNIGWGMHGTVYGAFHRFLTPSGSANSNPLPTFKCPDNNITGNINNDRFTVDDTKKGNGALKYPIGLITADEIVAAGSGGYNTSNSSYYLYKGDDVWSLSPSYVGGNGINMFVIDYNGSLMDYEKLSYYDIAVAPVINLDPEFATQLIGTGVKDDEYRLSGVN